MRDAPILVVGATGGTGSKVVSGLRGRVETVRAASRRGNPDSMRFDWYDPSTHQAAVEGVRAMYLVAPIGEAEPAPVVRPLLEAAVRQGLRRVVLLSSSAVEPADDGLGALARLVPEIVPEAAVLRPSWFMQNFTGDLPPAHGLRAGRVRSATGQGRVGFVDTSDIADVTVDLLTRATMESGDYVLTGPEALSYTEVCALASTITGRTIVHENISPSQLTEDLAAAGIPAAFAQVLAALDVHISQDGEDRVTDVVARLSGHEPRPFETLLRRELQVHDVADAINGDADSARSAGHTVSARDAYRRATT